MVKWFNKIFTTIILMQTHLIFEIQKMCSFCLTSPFTWLIWLKSFKSPFYCCHTQQMQTWCVRWMKAEFFFLFCATLHKKNVANWQQNVSKQKKRKIKKNIDKQMKRKIKSAIRVCNGSTIIIGTFELEWAFVLFTLKAETCMRWMIGHDTLNLALIILSIHFKQNNEIQSLN